MTTGTNMRRKAVAIRYEAGKDAAPRVSAKGEGCLAKRILSLARRAGVPIKEDADLVEVLSRLELNTEIPPETYFMVAEILAWVYRLNEEAGRAKRAD